MIFNGRFLTQRVTGVQRFAREIMHAASHAGLWTHASLLAPPARDIPQSLGCYPVHAAGRLSGHLWEQCELPRRAGDAMLIHLCNTAPLFRRNQMVVLHDAAVAALPENFKPAFRAWYQLMIRSYGKRARKIATVSRFSADEITRYFGIPARKIDIIPESGEHILRTPPDYSLHEKYALEQDGYFLAVSSHASNKNFDGVIKAVSRLPAHHCKFVIVGGRNARIFNATVGEASAAIEVGYASDAQLRALYERAACFVYPSFYEGFGLPPLEAMACGCPVLVSDIPSMVETCGDGVRYCNPYDPDDIARGLARILQSRQARSEMRESGLVRANSFTWKRAACRLDEILAQAS